MEHDQAVRVHDLVTKIGDILNAQQKGEIREKLLALATVTAWTILHVGGQRGFLDGMSEFLRMIDDFMDTLGPEDIDSANATHADLVAQVKAQMAH